MTSADTEVDDEAGFTLVEVMVAATLSLLLFLPAYAMLGQTYRFAEWKPQRFDRNLPYHVQPERGRQSVPAPDRDPERGAILVGMMMFVMLAALVMLSLAGRIVLEYRAVEDSVAQTRAYWSAMGFNNYVLSRTMVSGACGKAVCTGSQIDLSPQANAYLKEITDLQNWFYLDNGPNYSFQLNSTVCQDNAAPSGASGEVLIRTVFSGNGGPLPPPGPCPPAAAATAPPTCPAPKPSGPGTLEALGSLAATRPVEFRYCLVASGVTKCGAGPAGGTMGGPQLVTSVHRPAC